MHVLVIEDKRDSISGLFGYLESKGHVVDAVDSGILTRHLWMVMQYHAIILNVMSPGIDGLGLCRKLREDSDTTPPILMIAVRDMQEDKIACMDAGADGYIVKHAPLSEIELRLRMLYRLNLRTRVKSNYGLYRGYPSNVDLSAARKK